MKMQKLLSFMLLAMLLASALHTLTARGERGRGGGNRGGSSRGHRSHRAHGRGRGHRGWYGPRHRIIAPIFLEPEPEWILDLTPEEIEIRHRRSILWPDGYGGSWPWRYRTLRAW